LLTVLPDDVQREHVQSQRHEEQHEAEGERGERLGAVEFLVADEQRHDLYGHRRDRFERIDGEVRREAGGHHHDHRFADGARNRKQHAADDAGQRRAHHDLADGLRTRRTEGEGAVSQALRHGTDHVVGER
jgi:hypothetical protein